MEAGFLFWYSPNMRCSLPRRPICVGVAAKKNPRRRRGLKAVFDLEFTLRTTRRSVLRTSQE
jgi:hypothetical protein